MNQDDAFNRKYAYAYMRSLSRRDVTNPPILLIFSAVPGSGKTVLGRKIAKDFQAQYIDHDAIRELIRRDGVHIESVYMPAVSKVVEEAIIAQDKNKFIVLDGSVDRSWEYFFALAKKLRALPIVIRLEVPLEVVKKRIADRDGADSTLLKHIDAYRADFEECARHVEADLTLGETYDYNTVVVFLKSKLTLLTAGTGGSYQNPKGSTQTPDD